MKIARGVASIKVLPIFTCTVCGKEAIGSTEHMEVEFKSFSSLFVLDGATPSNNHMPIGWASYGRGNVKCEECSA